MFMLEVFGFVAASGSRSLTIRRVESALSTWCVELRKRFMQALMTCDCVTKLAAKWKSSFCGQWDAAQREYSASLLLNCKGSWSGKSLTVLSSEGGGIKVIGSSD